MIKNTIFIFLCYTVHCACLCAQPSSLAAKDVIKKLEDSRPQLPLEERSKTFLELSKAYYVDQNHEKAFITFLEALETARAKDEPAGAEDSRLYGEALNLYLDPHAQSTRQTASAILDRYGSIIKEHPEYSTLAFLVAASYANAGKFSDFFDLFYASYLKAPKHYLAYKTKAILHIKLFEKASSPEAKEYQRRQIIKELGLAADAYPNDHTLYKMMVAFAPQSQKAQIINNNLKTIVDRNMLIPRTDIGFYVEEAIKEQQFASAQRLIDKAREWYPFSRIINAAQEYLDQHKTRE